MATTLTSTQTTKIRFYLGYQDNYREMNSALESLLTAGLSSPAELLVVAILNDLAAIDLSLIDARKRLKALQVGSIELPAWGEIHALRREGRRMVARLASMYGVDINFDLYADDVAGGYGGGVIPLG